MTEEWNGTNWSEVNDLPYTSWYAGTAGDSSESGILFGGSADAYGTATAKTSLWNGTNWSEVGDMNTARIYMRGQGSTNNAIGVGGLTPSDFSTCTETWDGSSWSTAASMIVANRYAGVGGNGSGAIAAGLSQDASPYSNNNSELFQATFTTGSFGRLVATTLVGSAANLTNTDKTGTISSSAQIASRISGSFNKGFEYGGEISASISGSASFNTLTAHTLVGDGSALTNTISVGTVTGSAQLASNISGSFNKGFEVAGNISGSSTSSGSFGKVIASEFVGSGANITNLPIPTGVVSGSAQLASNISASFQGGFEFAGTLGTQTDFSKFAYSFDGSNDFAQIAKGLELNHGKDDPWSVSSWVFFDDTTDWQTLVGDRKSTGGYNGWAIYARGGSSWSSSEKIAVNIKKNDSKEIRVRGSSSVPALTWTHIAVTYDGSSNASGIKIYVNGVAETVTVIEDALDEWDEVTDNLYVGARGGSADFFKGDIDELAIFTGSLSANSVSSIYNGGHAFDLTKNKGDYSESADLQVFLRMGESGSDGSMIYDHSENQRSASVSGASIITDAVSNSLTTTGSFGRVENATYFGDGTSIRDTLGRSAGILTGSAQIATAISGAILGGKSHHLIIDGQVSGSIFSTGSFGDLRVKYLTGDGTSISASILSSISHLAGTADIASYVSGAFTSGFELFSLRSGSGDDQIKSYTFREYYGC